LYSITITAGVGTKGMGVFLAFWETSPKEETCFLETAAVLPGWRFGGVGGCEERETVAEHKENRVQLTS
jgi:hypothetical protein